MSEQDESLPKSERPTLKFPVGDDLLPGESPEEIEEVTTNPGPPELEKLPDRIQATSNPGPPPKPSPRINPGPPRPERVPPPPTANPGPPRQDLGDPPKINPGPPQS